MATHHDASRESVAVVQPLHPVPTTATRATRAVPRDVILFVTDDGQRRQFSMRGGGDARVVLGLAGSGYRLIPKPGGGVDVVTPDGRQLPIDAAVERGMVHVVAGYSYELLKNLFQMAMHNAIRSDLIFQLLRAGENPFEWDLETHDDRVSLLDATGHARASIETDLWWRMHDPDSAGEIAATLAGRAGLFTQYD